MKKLLSALLAALAIPLMADVPEISGLVPEAKDFNVIYKLNPAKYQSAGYTVDNTDAISGDLKRIAYFLRLTSQDDSQQWVYVSMEPFTKDLVNVGVPEAGMPVFQQFVENMFVASNVQGLATGNIGQGNMEFWPFDYGPANAKNIEGASATAFDFGDSCAKNGGSTCMQIHNYKAKQVVFAFNLVHSGNPDVGIGTNTKVIGKANFPVSPDWTFAANARSYKNTELIIAGQFDNYKFTPVPVLDINKCNLMGFTDKDPVSYKIGEEMVFTLKLDFGGQTVTKPYFIDWKLASDDGKTDKGRHAVADGDLVIKTSISKPGFVRLSADAIDAKGRRLMKNNPNLRGDSRRVFFDGGAGAEIDKIPCDSEPADFDAFWARQKARLNAVPFIGKATMTQVPSKNPKVNIYAVSVPCAGPHPCTGYLTVPANAKEKSLGAVCIYYGYGCHYQTAPTNGSESNITFQVNAFGYELGRDKDKAYQDAFFKSINVDGASYAFSAKLNQDPEACYFNGMTLRIMRSMQFVMSLPEWDGKNLQVCGGSQGGLQTVWAASLEPKVTDARPSIPWCCDLSGKEKFGRIHGGWRIVGTPALAYYDPIYICRRIAKTCHVTITRAGLGDYVCPPSGVALLYNNIQAPKTIHWVQGSTHGFVPSYKGAQKTTLNAPAAK